jgi:hypothetical protein
VCSSFTDGEAEVHCRAYDGGPEGEGANNSRDDRHPIGVVGQQAELYPWNSNNGANGT